MARGDPDSQRPWANRDLERRAEIHSFAVHPRVHGLGGPDLNGRRVPRPSQAAPGIVRWIKDEDAEPAASQGRPGAGHQRPVQRVGVVGDEYDGWAMMLADEAEEEAAATIAIAAYCINAAEYAVVQAALARAEADSLA